MILRNRWKTAIALIGAIGVVAFPSVSYASPAHVDASDYDPKLGNERTTRTVDALPEGWDQAAAEIPVVPEGTMFGIDSASPQAGIDLDAFAEAGGAFAIIKQGGGNAFDAPYVAPFYLEQLADARAAGLPVGHYWFNGQKLSVEDQARFFVETARIEPGDIIALDIEDEPDTDTRAFTPDEAARWITEVQKTYSDVNVLLYLNRSLLKGANWSALTDQPLWAASWSQNDGTIGKHPQLKYWKDWAIWQYSSVVRVPGFNGPVDGNIAKLDLFDTYGWQPAE